MLYLELLRLNHGMIHPIGMKYKPEIQAKIHELISFQNVFDKNNCKIVFNYLNINNVLFSFYYHLR